MPGREWEADSAKIYFPLNKIKRSSSINIYPILWRLANDEATGMGTVEVVAANLHTSDSDYSVTPYRLKQKKCLAAVWVSEQPSLEQHWSTTYHEEGARNSAPNVVCFTSPWPAYHSRTWPISMRSKQESKNNNNKKKNNTSIYHAWNVCTLIDRNDTDRPHRHTTLIASEFAR